MMFNDTVSGTVQLYDALRDAIFNDAPLSILYRTGGDLTKSRVIHPLDIAVGTKGSDLVWVHDSLRDGIISLRLDRIVAWSAVTETRQDWEDSPQGRAIAGR
jgi:predicted DNA-binding transcriptional regulator YafY